MDSLEVSPGAGSGWPHAVKEVQIAGKANVALYTGSTQSGLS